MPASVSGIGRLALWEKAATGILTTDGLGTGLSTAASPWRALPEGVRDDDARFDAWALVRLAVGPNRPSCRVKKGDVQRHLDPRHLGLPSGRSEGGEKTSTPCRSTSRRTCRR
jgi:hypothetical protein